MTCQHRSNTQAWFDNELDAAHAEQASHHVRTCVDCSDSLDTLRALRNELRATVGALQAPSAVRLRVRQSIRELRSHETSRSSRRRLPAFWWGAVTGAIASSALIAVLWMAQNRLAGDTLLATLVNEHGASLLSGRLVSIESSEHHTVKPWFATHADVSPVVEDFSAQGFKLMGGRIEPLQHQRAAVAVYRYGAHLIDVFSWAKQSQAPIRDQTIRGFHVNCWALDDIQYCAVSDVGTQALSTLKTLLTNEGAKG